MRKETSFFIHKFIYFRVMKKTAFIKLTLLLIAGFCACKNPTNIQQPANLLPLDSVAVLVADCLYLESEIYVKQWQYDMKDYATAKYDTFFAAHEITKEILMDNVRYYFTHKKYSEKIMNKVDEIVEQRAAAN